MDLNIDPEPTTSVQAEIERENPVNYGWTQAEKFELLQAIKDCGSKNIRVLANVLKTKTPNEIRKALKFYKKKAFPQQPKGDSNKRNKRSDVNSMPTVPLACWAKILSDTFTYEELQTETAIALRVIADCETIPPPMCTENINFKEIYRTLANAMEGKNIAPNNAAADVLEKCVTKTAILSKKFIRKSALQSVFNGINLNDKDMNQFSTPTNDVELGILRKLISQRNYNPFNIPEKYLKNTFDDIIHIMG